VEGALDVVAGVVALLWPAPPLFALIFFVAVWAVLTGGFAILAAVLLRREMAGDWLLFLSGAGSVLLGVLVLGFPRIARAAQDVRARRRALPGGRGDGPPHRGERVR
jgi:uncharacterized membrane protein HdeD (DUF308 family)